MRFCSASGGYRGITLVNSIASCTFPPTMIRSVGFWTCSTGLVGGGGGGGGGAVRHCCPMLWANGFPSPPITASVKPVIPISVIASSTIAATRLGISRGATSWPPFQRCPATRLKVSRTGWIGGGGGGGGRGARKTPFMTARGSSAGLSNGTRIALQMSVIWKQSDTATGHPRLVRARPSTKVCSNISCLSLLRSAPALTDSSLHNLTPPHPECSPESAHLLGN